MNEFSRQHNDGSGIVTIVMDVPCFSCHRLARYTVCHRAGANLRARLAMRVRHLDVHEILWELEHQHQQTPVGMCVCGAAGQETTSLEFVGVATRADLDYIAPDLSYTIRSLTLDDQLLWQDGGDLVHVPDPTPDEAIAASKRRMVVLDEALEISAAGLRKLAEVEAKTVGYIQAKARLYCRIGADAYRRQDALGEPDAGLQTGELNSIDASMRQLAEGMGFSPNTPLEGVDASHSHALARTLHFDMVGQSAQFSDDGLWLLDALSCRHMMTPEQEVVLFNRIPSGRW